MTDEEVVDALRGVIHPQNKRNLVELGMIQGVSVRSDNVTVTLALPFMEIAIKDDLVSRVRKAITELDPALKISVNLVQMTQKERTEFFAKTEDGDKSAQSANRITHVVAMLSGKGGVGKSSMAALVAIALRGQEKHVGVLDADITGPSIPRMFGLHDPPAMGPIGILPIETATGIKVMSMNLLLRTEDEAVIWRGPLISKTIKQFWGEVVWGHLDYLIVDLPPGTSDASLTVMQSIPLTGVILVTSPQDLAGMIVRKAARMVEHMGAPILGLVENMSYAICPRCGERIEVFGPSQAMHTAEQLGSPLLGRLPLDPDLARRCDDGTIEGYSSEALQAITKRLAKRILETRTEPVFP